MNSIFEHLKAHKDLERVTAIKNKTVTSRQDHDEVGLLRDHGITAILEAKQQEDDADGHQKLTEFVESNLAVSKLTATAKRINPEFQGVLKAVMTRYGDYKPGPLKKVDRCVSKLENDYQGAAFPKAARLLDLVRGSVSFNTVSQLVAGYHGFREYIGNSPDTMKVARVKNGFIGDVEGGYRDLKVCVVFTSAVQPELKMICEVQLILNQYLFEKKKMHKLYSVTRDEVYYQMLTKQEEETTAGQQFDLKALKFDPVLKVGQDVTGIAGSSFRKCAVNSELKFMFVKSWGKKLSCVDIVDREVVFETDATG